MTVWIIHLPSGEPYILFKEESACSSIYTKIDGFAGGLYVKSWNVV